MKQLHLRKVAAVFAALVMILLVENTVFAAGAGVPSAVMQARDGVVRIVAEYEDGIGIGSGFAVGNEEAYHIVTNLHVVEDADVIYVYYGNDLYEQADVAVVSGSQDLCILQLQRQVTQIVPLPLQTQTIDTGSAVYALGYPFAADTLSMDIDALMEGEELNFNTGKEAMTVTDGIVSGIRQSTVFGDGSRPVTAIQTNTSISGGNSGGPLLDGAGNVVGVNTLSSALDTNISASVHVRELINILRNNGFAYSGPNTALPIEGGQTPAGAGGPNALWLWLGVAAAGMAVAIAVLAVALYRSRKKRRGQGVSLQDYLRGGR